MHKLDCIYCQTVENNLKTCIKNLICDFNCENCFDYITIDNLLNIREKYINDMKNDLNNAKMEVLTNIQKLELENKLQNVWRLI